MGVSTDAILCYGFSFEDGYEFPWDDRGDSEWDLEEWWLVKVHGYKPPFRLFTEDGNYIDGRKPPDDRITEYFAHRRAFKAQRPVPVELVMHCHGNYAMWILATPSSVVRARRGYPEIIKPSELRVVLPEADALVNFCRKWELEGDGPDWWLCSLWF